jgi:hypothetical protein
MLLPIQVSMFKTSIRAIGSRMTLQIQLRLQQNDVAPGGSALQHC